MLRQRVTCRFLTTDQSFVLVVIGISFLAKDICYALVITSNYSFVQAADRKCVNCYSNINKVVRSNSWTAQRTISDISTRLLNEKTDSQNLMTVKNWSRMVDSFVSAMYHMSQLWQYYRWKGAIVKKAPHVLRERREVALVTMYRQTTSLVVVVLLVVEASCINPASLTRISRNFRK